MDTTTSHIVTTYESELQALHQMVLRMGSMVELQLADAIEAIHSRDSAKAQAVSATDAAIDALDEELNAHCLKILALRQPMAQDLRQIIGAMKIARDLERIGDYAANLAKRGRKINRTQGLALTNNLLNIGSLVYQALTATLNAYSKSNTTQAQHAYDRDIVIDEAYSALIKEIIAYMPNHPDDVPNCTHLLFMAKNLERIGDRVTGIAENIDFIVTGRLPLNRRSHNQEKITQEA